MFRKKILLVKFGFFSLLIICLGLFISLDISTADTDSPLPGNNQELIYDINNEQIIMFGGDLSGGTEADLKATWFFSSYNQTWRKLSGIISPEGRSQHRMAYNTLTGKILLFGGNSLTALAQFNDTWEFDPLTNQWTELHPTTAPSARAAHTMYYDSEFNEVILYAGAINFSTVSNEMWAYNFSTNNWYQLHPSGGPGAGYGHSFAYDEANKVGVFFGGRFTDGHLINDVWFFNRSSITWTKKYPIVKPMERYHLGMTFNPIDETFIVFGGDNENLPNRAMDDTWIYNPRTNTWAEVQSTLNPPARCKHKMVFDQHHNKAILFGGIGESFSVNYNDLWIFGPITMSWSQEFTVMAPLSIWLVLFNFTSIVIVIHLLKSRFKRWV